MAETIVTSFVTYNSYFWPHLQEDQIPIVNYMQCVTSDYIGNTLKGANAKIRSKLYWGHMFLRPPRRNPG